MFEIVPLVFALVLVGNAIHTVYALFAWVRRSRMVGDIGTSRVRSAPQGYVELEGRAAVYDQPLRAPLTGSPCVWYAVRVREYVGGEGHPWLTLRTARSDLPLRLDDGSGDCLVDPAAALVTPRRSLRWYGPGPEPAAPPSADQLNPTIVWHSTQTRYEYLEDRIDAGDPLYAIGRFRSYQAVPEHLMEAERRRTLAAWKTQQDGLRRAFDRDGDGAVDAAEWERVRAAAGLASRRRLEALFTDGQLHTLSVPGAGQPYIISSLGQPDLMRTYRHRAIGSLVFLGLLTLVALKLFGDWGMLE